jgi:hypothetical protein
MRERYGDEPEEKLYRVDVTMFIRGHYKDAVDYALACALADLRAENETVAITEEEV